MAACSRISLFRSYNRQFQFCYRRLYSNDVRLEALNNDEEEIIIPYRIDRGPTDILKALASTIKKDPTAAHYKYEDDPYFIPISSVSKRSFALSKESGKKAARYFLENYSWYFKCNQSVPLIKAFEPPDKYTEKSDISEEVLKKCIDSSEVINSVTVHGLLKNKGISISEETKQSLLELLCFYNGEEPPNEDYYEEKWFAMLDRRSRNTWKTNDNAEKLFDEMSKDNAGAYNAMIKGCSKFHNVEKAFSLYKEMCDKDLLPSLDAFNALLSVVTYVKSDGDASWQLARELVEGMNTAGYSPDLKTMNALFLVISFNKRWDKARAISTQLLAEMKRLDIEPSLGTYYHLLVIFYFDAGEANDILHQILSQVENKDHIIRHPDDVLFFVTAMEICNKKLGDKTLAYRLNTLFERGNNCYLIGKALSESIYFRNFFMLLCYTEDFTKVMKIYERYVPNVYTPESNVMKEVLLALEFSAAYEHLPKICSDISLFEQTERTDLLTELLRIIGSVKHDEQQQEQLINMIWSILEKLDVRASNPMRTSMEWTGLMLSDMLKIFLDGKDLEKSWSIMSRLKEQEYSISGYAEKSVLKQFCLTFLAEKDIDKVTFCVKYAEQVGYPDIMPEVMKAAGELFKNKHLDEKEWMKLNLHLLGPDMLESESSAELSSEDMEETEGGREST